TPSLSKITRSKRVTVAPIVTEVGANSKPVYSKPVYSPPRSGSSGSGMEGRNYAVGSHARVLPKKQPTGTAQNVRAVSDRRSRAAESATAARSHGPTRHSWVYSTDSSGPGNS